MRVRAAVPSDARAIATVHVASWRSTYPGLVPDDYLADLSVEQRTETWSRLIAEASADRGVLVVEDDGEIVGFCHYMPSRDDDAGAGTGEITSIYLAADRWRHGRGTRLMDAAVSALRDAGYEHATLWVVDGNDRARAFYEARSWVHDGSVKDADIDTFRVRELRYARPLTAMGDAPGDAANDDPDDGTTDRSDLQLAWAFGLALAVVFTVVACVRWRITYSRSIDLAYFDQAAWLIQHGKPLFVTWRGLPLLADHFSPDIYPMAFAARLVPGGLGLVVLQSIALAVTVVPLWFVARRHGRLTKRAAILVVFVAATYPALWNLMLSGFHPEVVMVPVIVGAVLAALDRKWLWFALAVVLILCAKEDFALIVVGLGIMVTLRGDRRVGAATIVVGVAWLAVVVGLVMPALNGGAFTQAGRFAQYGATTGDVVRFIAVHPWHLFSDLATRQNAALLAALLLPLALTPLRGWRIVLAIVPYEWLLLLTNDPAYHLVRYHYTAGATGILLAASAVGVGALLRHRQHLLPFVAVVMVVAALGGFFWWSELGKNAAHRQWRNTAAIENARRDALHLVPRGAAVAVTEELVDAFSHRQYVYNFPQPFDYWAEPKHTGHTKRDRVAAISWVVVDTNGAWVWRAPRDRWLTKSLPSLGFRQVYARAGVLVFER